MLIMKSPQLRELNFGEQEGLHFDNLPASEKERFSQPDFCATGGESWSDVRYRATNYFKAFDAPERHLIFTHGGLIAAYLNHYFPEEMSEMPPNASFVGINLKGDNSGEPESVGFQWDFPYIEEDIWEVAFKDFKFEKKNRSDEQ